jgi:hypothetical protein
VLLQADGIVPRSTAGNVKEATLGRDDEEAGIQALKVSLPGFSLPKKLWQKSYVSLRPDNLTNVATLGLHPRRSNGIETSHMSLT